MSLFNRIGFKAMIIAFFAVAFLVVLTAATFLFSFINSLSPGDDDHIVNPPPPKTGEPINVLVVGTDKDGFRTDTMMLVRLDPSTKDVTILSIPRDTRVNIPGRGLDKINHAHVYGGMDLTIKTVEDLTNVTVHDYVKVDFAAFTQLVDLIDGVEVTVEKDLYYEDTKQDLLIDLKAGTQVLDGEKALQYVRFRMDNQGDIGRIQRQQKFLKALIKKMFSTGQILKIPQMAGVVAENVNTSITTSEVLRYFPFVKNLNLDNITMTMVPGRPDLIDGVSYWVYDEEALNHVLAEHFFADADVEQAIKIEILNGSSIPGRATRVAEQLKEQGFVVVNINNADRFDYKRTKVINHTNNAAWGQQVARLVSADELEVEIDEMSDIDITIILGG